MMGFKMEVVGYKDLNENLKRISRVLKGKELADSLDKGAQEIVGQAKRNVMRQLLYDEGDLWSAIKTRKINQWRVDVIVDVDHGAVHEFGYTGTITPRQRRFFWAKWAETGDPMWKALALSVTYTIPMRAYLRPAIDEQKRQAVLTVGYSLGGKFAHVVK